MPTLISHPFGLRDAHFYLICLEGVIFDIRHHLTLIRLPPPHADLCAPARSTLLYRPGAVCNSFNPHYQDRRPAVHVLPYLLGLWTHACAQIAPLDISSLLGLSNSSLSDRIDERPHDPSDSSFEKSS